MDDALRREVHGWLVKAASDLASARKLAAEPDPLLDTAIYHCQQAAEKSVKAFLTYRGEPFNKTHDVRDLIAHAGELEPAFLNWLNAGQLLTPYATAFRYPDDILAPDAEEFAEAFACAEAVVSFVLSQIPLEARPTG